MRSSHSIQRVPGKYKGRSAGTVFGGMVWVAAVPDHKSPTMEEQAADIFAKLDRLLGEAGVDRTHILSAEIHLSDLADKSVFDEAWNEWVGEDPAHWPQRTCVGAALVAGYLVEIKLVAASL